ncbi:hypothetical protein FQA47_007766 [Oryzias melastigma]|uniref:Uncharacterized protein n=1 Tax=Oryzias melastigma TaxID=30732 RepID=A0A834BKZ5_ORYME|nr:hypothetical protein FQA47_007766 [Oryzias melastigma]
MKCPSYLTVRSFFLFATSLLCIQKKHFRSEGSAVSDLIAAAMQFFFFFKYMTSAVILCMYICKQNEQQTVPSFFFLRSPPPSSSHSVFCNIPVMTENQEGNMKYSIQMEAPCGFNLKCFQGISRWEDLRGSFPD